MILLRSRIALALLTLPLALSSSSSFALPKYGPNAVPLSKRSNLAYFQSQPAPDFWALIPYYTGQTLGQQCSAASLVMVLNGARAGKDLGSDVPLVTIPSLLEKYSDDVYRQIMSATHFTPGMIFHRQTNRRLTEVLREAMDKLALSTPTTKIENIQLDLKHLDASRVSFHDALVANEKSADDFIVFSFMQGRLTGDPEGGSHVAVIGAYDAAKKLVLVLDPDRDWYEPYWSPEDQVFNAIADPDSDGEHPGWIHAKLR